MCLLGPRPLVDTDRDTDRGALSRSRVARLEEVFEKAVHTYWRDRKVSKCFNTARLESMNRSTQFVMHESSLLDSLPAVIELVMHFLKQVSVRS